MTFEFLGERIKPKAVWQSLQNLILFRNHKRVIYRLFLWTAFIDNPYIDASMDYSLQYAHWYIIYGKFQLWSHEKIEDF